MTVLSACGLVVRGSSDGHWRLPRHRWVRTESWTGAARRPWSERDGVAWLVERWLRAFGPGTDRDLKWWTGTTLGLVRRALEDVDAVEVALDEGTGWLLPDDLDPEPDVEPWAALLPPLDPTTMGWHSREWYVSGARAVDLVDSAGNAGPTDWWHGRVVGGWRQDDHGVVELQGPGGHGTRGTCSAGAGGGAPDRVVPRRAGDAHPSDPARAQARRTT